MDDIYLKVRVLGAYRAACAHQVWALPWSQSEETALENIRNVFEGRVGVSLMLKYLGIEMNGDPIVKHPVDDYALVGTLLESWLPPDPLGKFIEDAYGREAHFIFGIAQGFTSAYILARTFGQFGLNEVSKGRYALIKKQRDDAFEFLTAFGQLVRHEGERIVRLFGPEIASLAAILGEHLKTFKLGPRHFSRIEKLANPIVSLLVPTYAMMHERLARAWDLRLQLLRCPPGKENWRSYEDICFRILRFVFVPPFRQVISQARSADGHQVRDAVLPNNHYEGFWATIRNEFRSRHIVCEFKNGGARVGKNSLNQLRIYLCKPTIGRFGLLFIRKPSNQSLKKAQREAYEQHKTLILILDDERVVDLIYSRCFLGSADDFLAREKILFEMNY
jgi:hypothetical protein